MTLRASTSREGDRVSEALLREVVEEEEKGDAPESDGRDEGPGERERQDDGKVAEKVVLLELVPAVEDDGRQEHVEEDGRLERDHVAHDVARGDAHDGADEHACFEGDGESAAC